MQTSTHPARCAWTRMACFQLKLYRREPRPSAAGAFHECSTLTRLTGAAGAASSTSWPREQPQPRRKGLESLVSFVCQWQPALKPQDWDGAGAA